MSDRADFNNKAEEILDFVDAYDTVRYEHLEKLFPGSNKIVGYLIKNQRLYKSADGLYISKDHDSRPDKCVISALNVLADVVDKIHTHKKAAAPALVSFLTNNGDYYEIIYAEYGMEAMLNAAFEIQLSAKKLSTDHGDITKRMVIVENKNLIERLKIPGIARFALVAPDGSLSYFKTRS